MKGVRTQEGALRPGRKGGRAIDDEGAGRAFAPRRRAEAEDVVRSAFLRACRPPGGFREDAAFRPWLWRIVVNETRNTVRSAGRLRAVAGRAVK
ncbi:sigma factor [Streptomyces sp. NPDC057900]|uniref:sigma factor n=1 Tax=Streptomyces sp. NPDC057900 TaxID=3346274 RepID=UPI0036EF3A62